MTLTLKGSAAAALTLLAPAPLWLQLYGYDAVYTPYVWCAVGCHLCAVALAASQQQRPPRDREATDHETTDHETLHRTTRISVIVLMLLLPVVGVLLVLYITHQRHRIPARTQRRDWRNLSLAPPPVQDTAPGQGRQRLATPQDPFYVLRHSRSIVRKKAVLQSAKNVSSPHIVRLLRQAVTDPNDEIRLIGVSQLKHIESEINSKLFAAKERLTHAAPQDHGTCALTIAQLYFDFLYLGIADSALEPHYLAQANHYCALALENHLPEAALLAARIALLTQEPATAHHLLSRIKKNALPDPRVMPYIAETAFTQGDYATVGLTLKDTPAHSPSLDRVRRHWQ